MVEGFIKDDLMKGDAVVVVVIHDGVYQTSGAADLSCYQAEMLSRMLHDIARRKEDTSGLAEYVGHFLDAMYFEEE